MPQPPSTPTRPTPSPTPPLRALLALALGAVALLAAIAASALAGREGSARLSAQIERELDGLAAQLVSVLDHGMSERWHDIHLLAALPAMGSSAEAAREYRRAALVALQENFPDYALVAFIRPDGIVEADSRGLLEGMDVSDHAVFREARERPVVVGPHEAEMLANPLALPSERRLRLIDLGAPVRMADGTLAGVVSAHVDWRWAEEEVRDFLARQDRPGLEALLLSPEGRVLAGGPPALREALLALPVVADTSLRDWPDGGAWASGMASSAALRDYPGLGWHVVLRQPEDVALAPARALQRRILLWGLAVAAAAALLGWGLARQLTSPLRALAEAAHRLAATPPAAMPTGGPKGIGRAEPAIVPATPGIAFAEAAALRSALEGLVASWRAAEAARADGAARLGLVQDAARVAAFVHDLAADATEAPPLLAALWGLPEGARASRREILSRVHPDQRAAAVALFARLATNGGAWEEELLLVMPSGEERCVLTRGQVLPNPITGRPAHLLGVALDVTARRAAERRVRESEARLRLIQAAGRIGGYEWDLVTGRTVCSPEWARLHGLEAPDRDEERNSGAGWTTSYDDLLCRVLPEDRAQLSAAVEAAIARGPGPYEFEYRIRRADDGAVRVIADAGELLAGPDGSGRPARAMGAIRDVTARRAAEDALRAAKEALELRVAERTAELAEREAELARIYDRTPAAFHSTDPDGRLIRVSEGWCAFLGVPRQEAIGARVSNFMEPASAARWEAALRELIAGPDAVREREYRMRCADGSVRDVLLRARAATPARRWRRRSAAPG